MGKKILVSPLSWGLGHATRDLPIIRRFLELGHQVTIASSGRTLELLKREVPECEFLTLEDYPPPYTRSRWFILKFALYIPAMLAAIHREHVRARQIIRDGGFDLVLSDNRFGVCAPEVPCFFISHQLRFAAPWFLWPFELGAELFNRIHHRKFQRVIVPDVADPEANLSGKLSHRLIAPKRERYFYAGVLSSTRRMEIDQDVDLFVSISGPEPQRTMLEGTIRDQLPRLAEYGRVVVALGKPEVTEVENPAGNVEVHGFLDRARQQEMLNRAKLIISRSGYTTVMELAELGRKALLIPTPGQTEQVYLSEYYEKSGQFHSVSQYELDLPRDLEVAMTYPGAAGEHDTERNLDRLFEEVFNPHL